MNTKIFRNMVSLVLAVLLLMESIPSVVFASATAPGDSAEVIHQTATVEMGELVVQNVSSKTVQKSVAAASGFDPSKYVSMDQAVQKLRKQMKNRNTTISIPVKTLDYTSANLGDLWKDLFDLAVAHTGNPTEGDYILYHTQKIEVNITYRSISGVYYADLNFTIKYRSSAAQEKTLSSRLSTVMSQLKLDGKTKPQKIKAIYDYLTANITYDTKNKNNTSNLLKMSAYAALVNKTCVCQGYANLFYRMALEAGIDCRVITGTSSGEGHAWNIVKINDVYYNLDATWDATLKQAGRKYEYFLTSNANFKDHSRDAQFKTKAFNNSYPMASKNYVFSSSSAPKSPVITASSVSSSGKPKISWNKVTGAAKYEVYRATSKNGTYSRISTTTSTSLTNTSAVAGKLYYYKVKSVNSNGSKSGFSNVVSRTCDLARPTGVKATNKASSGKIKITWKAVEGAQKYEVYRSTSKSGTYSKLATVTGTSFTNTGAAAGKLYYYKVKAIHSNTSANSAFSSYVSRTCDLPRPDVTIARNSNGKPKLTWPAINGAVKYEIYRSTSKDGTYSKLTAVTGTSYINKKAASGKTYYYKVKAIHNKSNANSAFSTVDSIKSK